MIQSSPNSASAKALEAFKSGQDVDLAVYGKSSSEPSPEMDSSPDNDLGEEAATALGISDESETSEEANAGETSLEEFVVGGKKMSLDWNDPKARAQIKRELQRAGGASKLQRERDQLRSQKLEIENKHRELSDIWSSLESTFKQHGIRGVANLLAGKDGAYEESIRAEMARMQRYADASPAEQKQMELEEQLAAEKAEKARILADVRAETERAKADREAADLKAAEAAVHPVFDKYRFSGKLGNSMAEQHLDEALWSKAISNIQAIPEHELTQARIDKEFRTVAATFSGVFKEQGTKKADALIAKKKEDAQAAVSAAAKNGMKGEATKTSVKERIAKGDYKSSLLDVLTGKVKL